uniref:Protein angel homolog 2-like n=1 Tax=Dermatophagoides pteronyssinus TaxID=6956 RepID=A0A6P6XZ00_DERPT|nr:protein angel homolog 2-like [Dermatophagoides pteronyssinus]
MWNNNSNREIIENQNQNQNNNNNDGHNQNTIAEITTTNNSTCELTTVPSLSSYSKEQRLATKSSSSSISTKTNENCSQCNEYDQFKSDDDQQICLCKLNYSINLFDYSPYNYHQRSIKSMIFDNPGQIYNYINRCRRWIKVKEPDNVELRHNQFSITTYNILAQNLLLNHLYLYRENNKSDLEWLERSNRLKQELLELNSDIFCFQEFHLENFTTSILPTLKKRGYQMISKLKTGQNYDGCSILFKTNKFQLQDCLEIQMNRLDVSHLLDRDQVALVVKLRPIGRFYPENSTNLIVANTHLLFNPRRGDIKLAQLRLLLAEIQRFAIRNDSTNTITKDPYKMDYFPIILCGDFNSEPNSPLIEFIKNGRYNFHGLYSGDISGQRDGFEKGRLLRKSDLQMNGIDLNTCFTNNESIENHSNIDEYTEDNNLFVRHVFDFKSVYPTIDQFNLKFISTSTHFDCGLVDHIFYSHNHKNLHLSAFKQLMNKQNLKKIGNIPNSILGSDHIALSAKFFLL